MDLEVKDYTENLHENEGGEGAERWRAFRSQ